MPALISLRDQLGARNGRVDQRWTVRLLELLALEDARERPADVARSASRGVVAHVAEEERVLRALQRAIHRLFVGQGRRDEVELPTRHPEAARQALRRSLDGGLVVAGDHHGRMVAGFVGPCVANPDRGVDDAGPLGDLGDRGVDALRWLDPRAGLLAGQQHGHRDVRFVGGAALPALEPGKQVLDRPLLGLHLVFVRSHAVAGDQVGLRGQSPRHVPVQVHRSRDEGLGSHGCPYPRDHVALGVFHAHDTHRAVDVEEQPVEGQLFAESIEHLAHEGFIGLAGHRTARQRVSLQGPEPHRAVA